MQPKKHIWHCCDTFAQCRAIEMWDEDGFVITWRAWEDYESLPINYCPFCGEKIVMEETT